MTLTERNSIIEAAVRVYEREFPTLPPAALFELVCGELARNQGLAVTPDEIVRVLSALAEAAP